MFGRLLQTDPRDYALTVLRVVLGFVFFAHGAQKVLGWFGGYGFSGTMGFFTHTLGIPAPFAFLAICAEFLGGLGLIVGLLSRVAAFGIACEMVTVVYMFHMKFGLFMNWNGEQKGEGIEYHFLVLAMTLAIMLSGSGAMSIDAALSRGQSRRMSAAA
jgi:putative oxidoreductase